MNDVMELPDPDKIVHLKPARKYKCNMGDTCHRKCKHREAHTLVMWECEYPCSFKGYCLEI